MLASPRNASATIRLSAEVNIHAKFMEHPVGPGRNFRQRREILETGTRCESKFPPEVKDFRDKHEVREIFLPEAENFRDKHRYEAKFPPEAGNPETSTRSEVKFLPEAENFGEKQ